MSMSPKELLKTLAETQDRMAQAALEPIRQLTSNISQTLGLPEPPEPPRAADLVESLPDLPTPPVPASLPLPPTPATTGAVQGKTSGGDEAYTIKAPEPEPTGVSLKMRIL